VRIHLDLSFPLLARLGNKAFTAQDYNEAVRCYSEAIKLDSYNHIYFSNRRYAIVNKRLYDTVLHPIEHFDTYPYLKTVLF